MTTVLETQALSVALGGRPILRDLTFPVEAGAWLGVLGANGSGKTTLLRCLSGRLQPNSGRIEMGGEDVSLDAQRRALGIGFAPATDTLPGALRAGELLALLGTTRQADPTEPRSIYAAMGLESLVELSIGEMSAGMRQRVAVFAAFIGRSSVVLLDEPFNWLDPVGAFDLKQALRDLADDGLAIVTALHDVATLATRCDAGLVLHNGQIVERLGRRELDEGAADLRAFEQTMYARFSARLHTVRD